MGEFSLDGKTLRKKGINRIGNMLVPNKNYCAFEEWFMPILDTMVEEQKRDGTIWTPSSMIHRLGKEINHPESVYYWCYKNNIRVFSPALTDGSIGDMIYFHSFNNPGLILDIARVGSLSRFRFVCRILHALSTNMCMLGLSAACDSCDSCALVLL
jgi:deoxyhypusine synthase